MHGTKISFYHRCIFNTQVPLAPTPVSPVADMVADIEVHMVADMKVDSNINIINFFHKHHNIINDYHRLSLKCTPIQSQFATSFPLKYKSFELGDQL